jgi:hypothetical protein
MSDAYTEKVQTLLSANHFPTHPKDPNGKHQKYKKHYDNAIQSQTEIKYLIQKKPSPPNAKNTITIT